MASQDPKPTSQPERSTEVADLVSRALQTIAQKRASDDSTAARWIARLRAAVTSPTVSERDTVVAEMRAAGISVSLICDTYIPAVARELGDEWCADRVSFADVTIGSSRLQALLRDAALSEDTPSGPFVDAMIMVLADEYHTLGAMVLTGQLRRLGASVRLVLGRPAEEVRHIVTETGFDAVMVSVALADDFEAVHETITALRRATRGTVPMIVGGGISGIGADAALRLTGADHVTSNPLEALQRAGFGNQNSKDGMNR